MGPGPITLSGFGIGNGPAEAAEQNVLTASSRSKCCSSHQCPLLGVGASSPLRVRCHFWVQPNHAGSRAALEIARFKLGIPQQIPHQGCSKGLRTPPHIATSAYSWPRRARRMKSVTWALCQLGTCTALSRLDFCFMP